MKYKIEKHLYEKMQKLEEINKNHLKEYRLRVTPRDIINSMIEFKIIKSYKEADRTLEKWVVKGIYDYGSSIDMGWLINSQKNFDEIRKC